MVDTDNEEVRNGSLPHERIDGLLDVPRHATERARGIEKVLAVVEIEHGIRNRAGESAAARAAAR